MKKIKTTITLSVLTLMLSSCQSTLSNANTPTASNSSNTKVFPYKSAIIKYKQKDQVLIWDDWGVRTYESRYNDKDIIMINNGAEYRIDHKRKKITKMRNLIMDWLIVTEKDLRPYYVASDAEDTLIRTGQSEKVAGQNGKNYSSFNPTQYTLFMSLKKLKQKKLISPKPSEQEDISIYIDREFSGHFGRFKDKSNKVRYKASEINDA